MDARVMSRPKGDPGTPSTFDEENCRMPVISNTITGSYASQGQDDDDTKKIDVKFETWEIRPLNIWVAAAWRFGNICEKSDWNTNSSFVMTEENKCEYFLDEPDEEGKERGPNPGNEIKTRIQVKEVDGRQRMLLGGSGDDDEGSGFDEDGRENIEENTEEVFYKVD